MGFEPTTPTLARLCSTPELRPRSCQFGVSRPAQSRLQVSGGIVSLSGCGFGGCRDKVFHLIGSRQAAPGIQLGVQALGGQAEQGRRGGGRARGA
jgi:hypothetical protein